MFEPTCRDVSVMIPLKQIIRELVAGELVFLRVLVAGGFYPY